jgi:hypothetical protein
MTHTPCRTAPEFPDQPAFTPPEGAVDCHMHIYDSSAPFHSGASLPHPGATVAIGGDFVARATPDGFTLLGSSIGPMAILTSLNPNLPYDSVNAFEPVTMIGRIAKSRGIKGE